MNNLWNALHHPPLDEFKIVLEESRKLQLVEFSEFVGESMIRMTSEGKKKAIENKSRIY